MKVNEIMIGDWVWVNDYEHLRPMQVAAIKRKSGSFYAECVDPYDATENCECIVDKLKGIVIDEHFLQVNGFAWDTDVESWIKSIPGFSGITWSLFGEDGEIDYFMRVYSPSTRAQIISSSIYVHQLQHALALCGITLEVKPR